MKPIEWINKAKEKENIETDYKLAKMIGIKPSALVNIRKRNNGMDNFTAVRIAEILEINRMKIIIDMEIQKAKTKEKKEFWEKKEEIYL